MGQWGQLSTATEKVWHAGWEEMIYTFVASVMHLLFFEIYKRSLLRAATMYHG